MSFCRNASSYCFTRLVCVAVLSPWTRSSSQSIKAVRLTSWAWNFCWADRTSAVSIEGSADWRLNLEVTMKVSSSAGLSFIPNPFSSRGNWLRKPMLELDDRGWFFKEPRLLQWFLNFPKWPWLLAFVGVGTNGLVFSPDSCPMRPARSFFPFCSYSPAAAAYCFWSFFFLFRSCLACFFKSFSYFIKSTYFNNIRWSGHSMLLIAW